MVHHQSGRLRPILAQCTLPDYGHPPPRIQQGRLCPAVPLHGGREFLLPKIRPRGGIGRKGTSFMTVPKAAVHETDSSKPRKDEVRRSRELPIMKTIPEAARMQRSAKDQFGSGVLPTNSRHHSRPNRLINNVGHELACVAWEECNSTPISQDIGQAIKEVDVIVRSIVQSPIRTSESTWQDV